jgi:glucosamine--fructose-6-phosphate aminotransferase (isomerizing)
MMTDAYAATAGSLMAAEIAEQPLVIERLTTHGRAACVDAARWASGRAPRFVLLAARGTSDHAALYLKYLVEVRLGLPAGLMSPSTFTAYAARPDLRDVLVIALSQSGGSPDLSRSLEAARACGATTLALTNDAGSPLADAAELHLDLLAGPELAVAATKSYVAELVASWLLVDAWSGGDGEAARGLSETVARELGRRPEIAALADRFRFTDRVVLTGRGYSYPTAREAALKLMETSYVAAHAFSGADLLHGPLAMIDPDVPVVAVAPEGRGSQALRPVLELLRARGSDLTVVGGPSSLDLATAAFVLDDGVTEELAPVSSIVPLQLLALEMALARGHDPDRPRGLSKVTRSV